ncbi:hypothetical protein GCM10010885_12510 [Alicyclobacillus cellulosilyticus]|uniref:NERD domain-containing protein n=1 Tax=Alicyclobacillus cellulosilyticus TaxID=1003997 RepID=A0A917K8T1_9BACL|nr:nuclease-related domain-containing protein [Alicyclobacillus cellulosilyticus]GGJ04869.1 hypothetical protein GCM10010885_12510 [Alicyclobacillus cellulosilyticus]
MAEHFGRAGHSAKERGRRLSIRAYAILLAYVILGGLGAWFSWHWVHSNNVLVRYGSYILLCISLGVFIAGCLPVLNDKYDPETWLSAFDRGAKGEETVQRWLASLPDGYSVFHDIECAVGNLDHVVIGPTGVFVIETKSHSGQVDVDMNGRLVRNGRPFEKDLIKQSWREALWLRDWIQGRLGIEVRVYPLLVFSRAFVLVRRPVNGVTVLPGKWLVDHIVKRKPELTAERVQSIRSLLLELLVSGQVGGAVAGHGSE